ncbi:MAG: outer membrane beta-barrel protein [Flavisolibacter sp.]
MKKLLLAMFALGGAMIGLAQDTTVTEKKDTIVTEQVDTIKVGGMIIIKKKGNNKDDDDNKNDNIVIQKNKKKRNSNLSTNWWIMDIGFANVNDQTNYSSAEAQAFAPGSSKDNLKLKTKSVNVNLWFFMQRLNMVKHVVNLKYGLGLELNNYHFDYDEVRLTQNPTQILFDGPTDLKKNKLAVDYITVPMMLNINFTPGRRNGFGFSGGISAGYMYSARQKIKNNDDKNKIHDDFDLNRWKLAYIGELNLGPVKLYGSYAMESMWDKGLDQTPYNVGIRLAHW